MSKLAFASPAQFDEDSSVLRFEESDDFSAYPAKPSPSAKNSSGGAEPDDPYGHLKFKQEELLRLRHELEKKEREATELEERRQKEERFATGRREMCEKFSKALARLERELYNSQKAIEEITVARSTFERHLDILRAQQPEAWQRGNIDADLDHALASIEDAEDEYGKSMRRLTSVLHQDGNAVSAPGAAPSGPIALPSDFRACARLGFAFTLPLGVMTVLILLIAKFLFR